MRIDPLVGNSGLSMAWGRFAPRVAAATGLELSCFLFGVDLAGAGAAVFAWARAVRVSTAQKASDAPHNERMIAPVSQRDGWTVCESTAPNIRRKRGTSTPPDAAGAKARR